MARQGNNRVGQYASLDSNSFIQTTNNFSKLSLGPIFLHMTGNLSANKRCLLEIGCLTSVFFPLRPNTTEWVFSRGTRAQHLTLCGVSCVMSGVPWMDAML